MEILLTILRNIPLRGKILLAILILARIILDLFGHKIKGFFGEYIVKKQLEKLPNDKYKVLNDVLIKTDDGTTQIDHVVVSVYGIFVIETKHYKGWIHGKEFSDSWTQSIYKKKFKIPNPVKQNYGHIMSLKNILPNYTETPFHSIIVFSGSATLKNIDTTTDVIYSKKLRKLIMDYSIGQLLEWAEVEEIASIITSENIVDYNLKQQHVKDVRKKIEQKDIESNEEKCGYCAAILIKRNGKNGEFLGCVNFPKCRYTKSLSS